jgi:hypothetical protein
MVMHTPKWLMLFCALFCTWSLSAQYAKPQWVSNLPKSGNESYKFVEVTGMGGTLRDAELACIDKLSTDESLIRRIDITKVADIDRITNQSITNGKIRETTTANNKVNLQIKGHTIQLQANLVDEYTEMVTINGRQQYKVTALYMIALQSSPTFDAVDLSTKYGIRGLWRSVIVPGWGQMHKGSTAKGVVILVGEAALIGGIVYFESMRADNFRKSQETTNLTIIKEYRNRADSWALYRNVALGAAIGLYAYNLVDAIVAPGAKRVVVKRYAFAPVVTPEYAGLGLNIQF